MHSAISESSFMSWLGQSALREQVGKALYGEERSLYFMGKIAHEIFAHGLDGAYLGGHLVEVFIDDRKRVAAAVMYLLCIVSGGHGGKPVNKNLSFFRHNIEDYRDAESEQKRKGHQRKEGYGIHLYLQPVGEHVYNRHAHGGQTQKHEKNQYVYAYEQQSAHLSTFKEFNHFLITAL